ncbi:MAG TPA: amino acid adenylation domain-containing protein [Pseudolabrys sp.]|nr:amino acid adenylation domain-containing protein [Pseudolabrys sp.]
MQIVLPPDLTAAQAIIWLDQQWFPGKPIHNTGGALSIQGKLRFDLFETALRDTIAESPCLRCPPRAGPVHFDLPLLDFRNRKDPFAAAEQWMRAEMRKPFSLEDALLFRFALIRISEDQTLWFQKNHHLIIDSVGRRLLHARTAAHYRALRFGEPLAALNAATPKEILDRDRRYANSKDYDADRAYWLARLAQWPSPLLEINRENTERRKSGVASRISFPLKRADFARLETAARALGSSTFRAIIALTYVAFSRLYDRSDLALGIELAYRPDAKTKDVIGLMSRPLPLSLTFDPSATTADIIRHLEELRTRDYPHRHFPIQELIKSLGITRKGYHGLFDVIVNYIPMAYDFTFENYPIKHTNLSHGLGAPWLVTIEDYGPPHDLDVAIDTDPGLISTEMATRLASTIETLLLHGMEDLACPLASLPIMPEAISERLRGFATGETVPVAEDATLASLCVSQAERTPDAIALISGDQQLTFATLHERAACLARRLAAFGVKPGVVVGIALPRTPTLIVAVLAVHKAGGTYLALDPSYPAERIRFMVADAGASIILTEIALAPLFTDSGARLLFDTDPVEVATAELVPARPDDLAYVLYTSGSTGRPKAVGTEHRNLINLLSWGRSVLSDAELGGVLFSTSLNFDLSAFEMFLPLAFGGCIVLVENLLALKTSPMRERVRFVNTGPSLLDALLRVDGLPNGVTTAVVAGEKLSRHLASSLFDVKPGIRLLNCYGPTETTVYSSCAVIGPSDRDEPTIGRPIWNTTLHVLGGGLALLPPGVEGELFIGGAGVTRGYLGRPELTAERFLPNRYGMGRLYRTGDRVRWREDGALEFLGRTDDQIKIRGMRIEPGEIEANLLDLPEIDAVVVKLCPDATDTPRLTAYLVGSSETPVRDTDRVRTALEKQMPRHMVPEHFVWLDAMPMTPNGKVDRKALPALPQHEICLSNDSPPTTELERELAAIWEELLQVSPVGVRSDFFDLGGDSLAVLSLFATIEARFGRRLTVDVLAGGLTIAGLAELIARKELPHSETGPVVTLQPFGDLPPFFCVHGIGGDVLHLHRLATHMGSNRPFLGLRQTSDVSPTETLNEMATRYVAAMLRHQPVGPYYLGGFSFGAIVAYEMAVQLLAQGHEVGRLVIIDQRRPGWRLKVREALPAMHRILGHIPHRLGHELARIPAADRLQHIQRTLLRWSKAAIGIRDDAAAMFGLSDPEQIAVFDANLRALRSYRPTAAPAPITLFRAKVQLLSHLALDSSLGWHDLTKGEVRVHMVPGDHASVVAEPMVRELAKMISVELNNLGSK